MHSHHGPGQAGELWVFLDPGAVTPRNRLFVPSIQGTVSHHPESPMGKWTSSAGGSGDRSSFIHKRTGLRSPIPEDESRIIAYPALSSMMHRGRAAGLACSAYRLQSARLFELSAFEKPEPLHVPTATSGKKTAVMP